MATMTEPIHARSMTYVGHAYTGSSLSVGPRVYSERKLPDGQIELVCGRGLWEAHRASGEKFPWATLRSKKSREAKFVTCPECRRRLRAAGFIHSA